MRALLLLLAIPAVMWLTQTALLLGTRQPVRLRISPTDLPRRWRGVNRVVTKAALLAAVLLYPLLRGQMPLEYYSRFFPTAAQTWQAAYGAAAAILYLTLLYLAWTLSGNVQFEIRSAPARLLRRWAGAPLAAVLIALAEELLFRGMLLADLLDSFRPAVAVPVGVVCFAAAHYVRSVKRHWTFAGHLALGTLFCLAFLWTQALWLPLGLHAGGVLVLLAVRPVIRYTGPAWLVGASIYPYAGAVGVVALLLLTANIWFAYAPRITPP